nr:unnamed protein product [Digitaria exilis]
MSDNAVTVVRIIVAIILPPLGVFLKHGCKIEFWICLLLSFLAYLPGMGGSSTPSGSSSRSDLCDRLFIGAVSDRSTQRHAWLCEY